MCAPLVDIDRDGDIDLVTGTTGDVSGQTADAPYRAFINDGMGMIPESPTALPAGVTGNGFDLEPGDFDGDGRLDPFLESRRGTDLLRLAEQSRN